MSTFDTSRGAFYLVAVIICTMMVLLIMGMSTCVYLAVIGTPMPVCNNLEEFGKEIITMAFTAALAFAGGRMSAPSTTIIPPPKLPPPKPPKPPDKGVVP